MDVIRTQLVGVVRVSVPNCIESWSEKNDVCDDE